MGVLDKDDAECLERLRVLPRAVKLYPSDAAAIVKCIDRLVARVEMLEKVAAAAETYVNWAPTPKTERALVEALFAINPKETTP